MVMELLGPVAGSNHSGQQAVPVAGVCQGQQAATTGTLGWSSSFYSRRSGRQALGERRPILWWTAVLEATSGSLVGSAMLGLLPIQHPSKNGQCFKTFHMAHLLLLLLLHVLGTVWFAGSLLSSNKTSQQVILQFPQALPLQPLVPVLRLQFSYPLLEGLDGFYRSSYIGEGAWGWKGENAWGWKGRGVQGLSVFGARGHVYYGGQGVLRHVRAGRAGGFEVVQVLTEL